MTYYKEFIHPRQMPILGNIHVFAYEEVPRLVVPELAISIRNPFRLTYFQAFLRLHLGKWRFVVWWHPAKCRIK